MSSVQPSFFRRIDLITLWVSLAILAGAVVCDLRSREIPNVFSMCLLLLASTSTGLHWSRVNWLSALAGLGLGLAVGVALFWMGGFGGGDVKLMGSLGAVLGWEGELGVLFWMALFGGLLGVVARMRGHREYAYVPAIALGLLAFIVRGYFR